MSVFVLLENTIELSYIIPAGIFGNPLSFNQSSDLIQNKHVK